MTADSPPAVGVPGPYPDARRLDAELRRLLAGARLEATPLPLVPEIRLWRINAGDPDLVVAADVLYDRDNLSFLPCFRARAGGVLVADSRVRDFSEPGYGRLWSRDCVAVPDLGEAEWVQHVTVYGAGDVTIRSAR